MRKVEIFNTPELLARSAADAVVRCAEDAKRSRGCFSLALCGGETPLKLYSLLASADYSKRLDWSSVHLFWGDERCVPPAHPESNYRAARELLLDRLPLPAGNIHRMRGELEPAVAADLYEAELNHFFRTGKGVMRPPRFDLLLLGMGADGHTASLFPGTAPLRERSRWVIAHYVDPRRGWRITLTPVVINAAAAVLILVSGRVKAAALQAVFTGSYRPDDLPIQIVRPESGNLRWKVDCEAAALLHVNDES